MNIEQFLKEGRLKRHKTSSAEISELFRVVKRDIADAKATVISNDRRFATAYNAVLQLAPIVMVCRGLRAAGWMHHYTTFEVLYEISKISAKRQQLIHADRLRRSIKDRLSPPRHKDTKTESRTGVSPVLLVLH